MPATTARAAAKNPTRGRETADWYIHGQTVATPDWGPTAMESASSNIVAYKAAGNRGSRQLGIPLQERRRVAVDRGRRRIRRQQPLHLHDRLGLQGFGRQGQCRDRRSRHLRLLAAARGRTRLRDGRRTPSPSWSPTHGDWSATSPDGVDLGDFSTSEEGAYLVRKGVALTTASEFKIRFNNAWDDSKNYGTALGRCGRRRRGGRRTSPAAVRRKHGKPQLDGTYDIYFDLANSQIYIMSEGKTPAEAE